MFINSAGTLVSCSNDTTLKVWRVHDAYQNKHKRIAPISTLDDHDDYVRAIAYSPVQGKLFSAADNGVINLWDMTSERLVQRYKGIDNKEEVKVESEPT